MPLNIELAERVLHQITTYPETHHQRWYRRVNCKTTMCIAGWAADLAGGQWLPSPGSKVTSALRAEPSDPDDDRFDFILSLDKTVPAVSAHARARRLLGLSQDRADELFEDIPDAEAVAMLRRTIRSAKAARTRRERASTSSTSPGA